MNSEFRFYKARMIKRLPLVVVLTAVFTAASVFLAKELPTEFTASARLLLESPQIPDELAMSMATTSGQEQLEIIQQRLLTRANLLDIADKFDVLAEESRISPDQIISTMRSKTDIRLITGRNRATLMTITFTDDDARTSADVVNEYVTLILREDSRLRTSRASSTEEFFDQEVERLAVELDRRSIAIREFRSENVDALPETFEFRLDRLADLQQRTTEYTRDILVLNEQRKLLEEAKATQVPTQTQETSEAVLAEEEKLSQLREELAEATRLGSETSPRVRILRSRIQQVEQVIQSLGGRAQPVTGASAEESIDAQLRQIDAQLEFLQEQLETTDALMQEVEDTLDRTPTISVSLQALQRDYENAQAQYNAAVERQAIAQTNERIELGARGQRVTVVEQATVPTSPSSASPILVAAGGTAVGFLLALGLALALELVNKIVRRPVDLVKSLGITPIATLPYVRSSREIWMERAVKTAFIVAIVGGIPAALFAIHMFYLPLDLLAERVLNRLGV